MTRWSRLLAAVTLLMSGCGSGLSSHSHPTRSARESGGIPSADGVQAPPGLRGAWPVPRLHHPKTIEITTASTGLKLDPHTDYVLRLPVGHALRAPLGLRIVGGHNVVIIGGQVHVPGAQRALELVDQTGIVHIQDVAFTGAHLIEGIDLGEPDGATVELEDISMAEVHGSHSTDHADLVQTWAGPNRLLINGFVGSTDYQGFFLLPNQLYKGPPPSLFDLRNVVINDRSGSYALWREPGFPLRVQNVVVEPNPAHRERNYWLWPEPSSGNRSWRSVRAGTDPRLVREVVSAATGYGTR
jgi:hypothetical protein